MKKIKSFVLILLSVFWFSACTEKETIIEVGNSWYGLEYSHSIETDYAKMFSVDCYEGGYARINIKNEGEFMLVPEGCEVPEVDESITVLKQPLDSVYLTAVSVMDLFRNLDEMDSITLTAAKEDSWYIEEAAKAMQNGEMLYAGKYSAPDYERIISEKCNLVVASTMMNHTPEVIETFESFGIPVIIDKANYEDHPLGKMEWIKLYGVLYGKEKLAEEVMQDRISSMENILDGKEKSGKSVVFFYVTENDNINVRKPDDYISKMIEIAGGEYAFDNLEDGSTASSINLQIENFYAEAKDADVLIYNSTMGNGVKTIDELVDKNELFADFKAVKNANVWCMSKKMHQETMSIAHIITEFNMIFEGDADENELEYIIKVK